MILGESLREGAAMDHDIHALSLDEGLAGVPYTLVVTGLAPTVLNHVVLVAPLVTSNSENLHSVVVGDGLVVEPLLEALLA